VTVFNFNPVPVWGSVGEFARIGAKASTTFPVTDEETGDPCTVTQEGNVQVGYVRTDDGRTIPQFSTTDVPVVVVDFGFAKLTISSPGAVRAAAQASIDAAASAASAQAAANLVGAPADSAIAAAITPGSGSASEAVLNSTIAAAVTPKADQSDLDDVVDGTTALPYAPKAVALQPTPLAGAAIDTTVTLRPLENHGGFLWASDGSTIKKSADGVTWTTVATAPGAAMRILWCADGEVLVLTGEVYRSSGWATNPATATWAKVVTKSAPAGPGIPQSHFDGDGTKFIAAEYSDTDRTQSRYVWISTNQGVSWSVVYDDRASDDPTGTLSHRHGVAYDPWEDRFWRSEGHDTFRGLYYSDNDGSTWTLMGGAFQPDAAPFSILATDDGLVCGSDSADGGLYGVARTTDPATLEMRHLARWRVTVDGVVGLASRATRDPDTGIVYVTYQADNAGVAPTIAAGTARAGAFIWTHPSVGVKRLPQAVPFKGILYGIVDTAGTYDALTGSITAPGVVRFDSGNMDGGTSTWATSVAAGPGAHTDGISSVAVGKNAATSNESSVAIGDTAATTQARAVAAGRNSVAYSDSVAVGYAAGAGSFNQTAVGASAVAYSGGTGATALGNAAAAGSASVAVGRLATAGSTSAITNAVAVGQQANAGNSAVALGRSAVATHTNAVALGANTTTTVGNQVQVGARHLELTEVTAPGVATANGARLYVKDNGSGKTQLVVIFQSGAEVVLATEA
jgi:hypothetical protein